MLVLLCVCVCRHPQFREATGMSLLTPAAVLSALSLRTKGDAATPSTALTASDFKRCDVWCHAAACERESGVWVSRLWRAIASCGTCGGLLASGRCRRSSRSTSATP
jgi:hypothetical protein